MFGFSRRRMKLGRVKKVQLSDPSQGTRSPMRHPKRTSNSTSESLGQAGNGNDYDEHNCQCSSAEPEINNCTFGNSDNWMVLSIAGDKPIPRFNHGAAVVGNKMIVVGGESGSGLLDDVQVLTFDRFTWTLASSKIYLSPSSLPLKIPACKGHCLVSWGKKVLLIGGKTNPASDKVSVWTFDTETECWSLMEAKGDTPVARSGHTVVRASSVLILFGGEDAKRRKLNDLHMFDLKSLTWLPLHCTGTPPSPRANHVAALYDDKTLLIFGGASKSKTLNDFYSLDFETMIWSRMKVKASIHHPELVAVEFYVGPNGHSETLVFDILKAEWSVAVSSPPSSVTTNKGFSLVLVQHKEKDFLVAFGGSKKEPLNQVEVLIMEKNGSTAGRHSTLSKGPGSLLFEKHSSSNRLSAQLSHGSSQRSADSVARQNLASAIEHGSGRKSLSEFSLNDPNSGNVSLRKEFHNEVEYNATVNMAKLVENESLFSQAAEHGLNPYDTETQANNSRGGTNAEETSSFEFENAYPHNHSSESLLADNDSLVFPQTDIKSGAFSTSSSTYQFYETKMAALIRKNGILEGQLAASLASRETAEKNLSSALRNKQDMEKKLADAIKEMELLKEKLGGLELAQEEANNLSNIVHSDNVRLEHDVAFLKAVLDDTQKELRSTRGVLAGERARAFQLQVEVFHLKQRLQSLENRTATPRKPFHV